MLQQSQFFTAFCKFIQSSSCIQRWEQAHWLACCILECSAPNLSNDSQVSRSRLSGCFKTCGMKSQRSVCKHQQCVAFDIVNRNQPAIHVVVFTQFRTWIFLSKCYKFETTSNPEKFLKLVQNLKRTKFEHQLMTFMNKTESNNSLCQNASKCVKMY